MIRFNHVSTHPRIRPNVWRLPTNLGSKAIPRTGCCASGQMQWRSQHIRSHRGWTNQHWHSNRFSFVVSKASANRATDVALMTSCDKTKVHTSTDPMDPGHRKCSALLRQGFCETKQRFWASGPSLSAEAIGGSFGPAISHLSTSRRVLVYQKIMRKNVKQDHQVCSLPFNLQNETNCLLKSLPGWPCNDHSGWFHVPTLPKKALPLKGLPATLRQKNCCNMLQWLYSVGFPGYHVKSIPYHYPCSHGSVSSKRQAWSLHPSMLSSMRSTWASVIAWRCHWSYQMGYKML